MIEMYTEISIKYIQKNKGNIYRDTIETYTEIQICAKQYE